MLSVQQDRGNDGTFVGALCVDDSLPPPFVQHNSDSVFVVELSKSDENVLMMCLPYFSLFMSPRFVQQHCVPSLSSIFSVDCIDLIFL